jgi:hypothetical protein
LYRNEGTIMTGPKGGKEPGKAPRTRKRKSTDTAAQSADAAVATDPVAEGPAARTEAPTAERVEARAEERVVTSTPVRDDASPEPSEEEIRRRAYELYLSRGGVDGDDVSDWLAAERLVRRNTPQAEGRNR